jgi:aryl-alcohol dehydrogenase-like predicted oxidoreductase
MDRRPLGSTGLTVPSISFGAFKIGRNSGIKYAHSYELPSDPEVSQLLEGLRTLGIDSIDTAPAYGFSEARLGALLPSGFTPTISTKVGERFINGASTYDFSPSAIRASINASRAALRRPTLDIVFIHSDGRDLEIQNQSGAVQTLIELRREGRIRAIGFSGKTVEGAAAAMKWADVLMVEFHLEDRSHESIIQQAHARGLGVVIKKGLASGRLDSRAAIEFILSNPAVDSLIIGGLNLDHLAANVAVAEQVRQAR